ncbi:pectate lyase, PelA/Pel-15E family [Rheinheimera pacifica]|uniref:Pectate lyase, PelA/Pel-15E family n=1 Tax=Rheinheimera pacifica TaxID=173990 RepID=A0A1H6MJF6_9GAMM|nr:pectate lyase [Rheinheimera pacifica]SEI01808.1 pectate lyase, PelA/Pel-15E family [Rheinheimera pacifica]
MSYRLRHLLLLVGLLLPCVASASYWQAQQLTAQWRQYLAESAQVLQQDATALAAEQQGGALTAATRHNQFGLTGINNAAEAQAVLSFQTPSGGWSKRTDMRIARLSGQQFGSEANYVPTFDNDATSTQLQWLADFYPQATPQLQQHIVQTIERGVALVLQAQYPNGGFPQSYPLRGGYHDAITLNDNALYQLMQLLWQVANEPHFAMLADSTKTEAAAAFYRAVDWLLANQVVVDGKRTVWGAQHHPLTGEPVTARKYEKASLVSSESAKILQLLLRYAPDYPGVAPSLAEAANWLRDKQISDKDRHRDSEGRLSLIDSPGSVIWSRFYDLKTGQPVFFDRDGLTYSDVSQISLERQRGYGWYQSVAAEFLAEYDQAAADKHCTNFGLDTPGGAGGAMLKVTNLNRSGPGSLAAALAHSGPRVVVFEVAGVIDLERTNLEINQPYLTIAGETAPAPGITLIKGGLRIISHDVIVRHLHIRPGDAGLPKRTGWDTDGIAVTGKDACNVLVEHNSISWATDELVSASGPRDKGPQATSKHITFRYNILAEALDYATHIKGKHSKGALVHDFSRHIAFIGNLFAHNARRNPYFKAHTTGVVLNNIIYNADANAVKLGFIDTEWAHTTFSPQNPQVAVIGNVLRYGRDSYSDLALVSYHGDAYLQDNLTFNLDDKAMYDTAGVIKRLTAAPVWPQGIRVMAAKEVEHQLLPVVGARYWQRDVTDQRIVQSYVNRDGRIIDSQQQVGGYPQIKPVHRPLQVPTDNINIWLESFIPTGTKPQEP